MRTAALMRAFFAEYWRNRVNVLLLVVVPAVFVIAVSRALADAARLLAGAGGPAVQTASAGWAAAFLAGIATYFLLVGSRDADRRLLLAGLSTRTLVAARLLTSLGLALLVTAVALTLLALRVGIDDGTRVAAGTVMFAVIYVAIGAVTAVVSRDPVNGTVVVLFIWIVDVFFGPVMASADLIATRLLPTHFVTLWMVDLPSGHGGRPGDLGIALAWTLGALAVGFRVLHRRTRLATAPATTARRRPFRAATSAAWADARRNPAQWVLYVLVPLVFVLGADAVTADEPIAIRLSEGGTSSLRLLRMPQVHAATMAPIAIASVAALTGLFVLLDSRTADRRTVGAGMSWGVLFGARLLMLAALALTASTAALAATALVFDARLWPLYAAGNVLLALTYALVGALLAPIVGRVGGTFLAFLLPFLDLGIAQSPMLHPEPTALSQALPGYGASRVLLDAALTTDVDEARTLGLALAWLLGLGLLVGGLYRRAVAPAQTPTAEHALHEGVPLR